MNWRFLGLFEAWRKLGIFLGFWWNRLILLSIDWGLDWIGKLMFEAGLARKGAEIIGENASQFVLCMGRDKGKVNFVDA